MSIGVADRKLLWGRSHNECAYPDCRQELTVDLADRESRVLAQSGVVLGEEAHIRSGRPAGPRYDSDYPSEQIDSYANLVLLCPTHHTLVDKDSGSGFSVSQLETMRADHEARMRDGEDEEAERRRILSERMAAAIQVWEEKASIEQWQNLTWMLNYPVPYLRDGLRDSLFDVGEWLLARDWPPGYPHIREAFGRFGEVVRVLVEHINESFLRVGDSNRWEVERAYKEIPWNPPLYEQLISRHRLNCAVTWFLILELTRSANWIIAAVRAELDPLYRFDEGILLMREGDGILRNHIVRIEYQGRVWGDPFPPLSLDGIKQAITDRAAEEGVEEDDVDLIALDV